MPRRLASPPGGGHCYRLLLSDTDYNVAIPHPIRERSARCPQVCETADPIIRLHGDKTGHPAGSASASWTIASSRSSSSAWIITLV